MSESFSPPAPTSNAKELGQTSSIENDLKNSLLHEIELTTYINGLVISLQESPPPITSELKDRKPKQGLLTKFPKLSAFFGGNTKSHDNSSIVTVRPLTVAETLVEKAKGKDLTQVSPLGALQIGIERINFEAKDALTFKSNLARRLFSNCGAHSNETIEILWGNSAERKVVTEIYALINMSQEVGRPITFRDAFLRIYNSRKESERVALDRIAKALLTIPFK